MGILEQGLFGGMSGRVGNKVYYMSRGKQCARMAVRSAKPRSEKQLANQQAMKVVIAFLRPIISFIQIGFGPEAKERNVAPHNVAVGYNKKHALRNDFPEIQMDYEKVLLSKGNLNGLTNPGASLVGNLEDGLGLYFDWDVLPEDREWPRCNDQVMLMAYFPEEVYDHPAVYTVAGARRQSGQDVLELPISMIGKPVEVYISVISEDRTGVADSRYLGSL